MISVIVDTNVIISALISKNAPNKILYNYIFSNKVSLILSDDILEEYTSVLSRDKFSKYPGFVANAELVIALINELAIKINPTEKVAIAIDPDDNVFLELAKASSANYIITGNIKDFGVIKFENTQIITPTDFILLNS